MGFRSGLQKSRPIQIFPSVNFCIEVHDPVSSKKDMNESRDMASKTRRECLCFQIYIFEEQLMVSV